MGIQREKGDLVINNQADLLSRKHADLVGNEQTDLASVSLLLAKVREHREQMERQGRLLTKNTHFPPVEPSVFPPLKSSVFAPLLPTVEGREEVMRDKEAPVRKPFQMDQQFVRKVLEFSSSSSIRSVSPDLRVKVVLPSCTDSSHRDSSNKETNAPHRRRKKKKDGKDTKDTDKDARLRYYVKKLLEMKHEDIENLSGMTTSSQTPDKTSSLRSGSSSSSRKQVRFREELQTVDSRAASETMDTVYRQLGGDEQDYRPQDLRPRDLRQQFSRPQDSRSSSYLSVSPADRPTFRSPSEQIHDEIEKQFRHHREKEGKQVQNGDKVEIQGQNRETEGIHGQNRKTEGIPSRFRETEGIQGQYRLARQRLQEKLSMVSEQVSGSTLQLSSGPVSSSLQLSSGPVSSSLQLSSGQISSSCSPYSPDLVTRVLVDRLVTSQQVDTITTSHKVDNVTSHKVDKVTSQMVDTVTRQQIETFNFSQSMASMASSSSNTVSHIDLSADSWLGM